jgi:hypothetical protein
MLNQVIPRGGSMGKVFEGRNSLIFLLAILPVLFLVSTALAGPAQKLEAKLLAPNILPGTGMSLWVTGGTQPYNISFSNPSVAGLKDSGTKIEKGKATYVVEGKKPGLTVISIKDAAGAKVLANLTVKEPPSVMSSVPPGTPPLTGGLPFYGNPQQSANQEAQQEALKIWAERQKAEKERQKQLKGLQDAVSKMNTDMEKNRLKTAMEVNKNIQRAVLAGE